MSLDYISEYYHVPAEKGRRVKSKLTGEMGTIKGAHGPHVVVLMDRDSRKRNWYFHPTDLEYLHIDVDYQRLSKMIDGAGA